MAVSGLVETAGSTVMKESTLATRVCASWTLKESDNGLYELQEITGTRIIKNTKTTTTEENSLPTTRIATSAIHAGITYVRDGL